MYVARLLKSQKVRLIPYILYIDSDANNSERALACTATAHLLSRRRHSLQNRCHPQPPQHTVVILKAIFMYNRLALRCCCQTFTKMRLSVGRPNRRLLGSARQIVGFIHILVVACGRHDLTTKIASIQRLARLLHFCQKNKCTSSQVCRHH